MKRLLIAMIAGLSAGFFVPAQSQVTDRIAGVQTGLAIKAPVQAVATSNITLSGEQTIGSVAVVEGERVLVVGQTDATENGIYVVDSTDWERASDFDGNRDVVQGTLVIVYNDIAEGVQYQVTAEDPIVIGTTEITFDLRDDPAITYAQTAAEVAAGVTPVVTGYPPLDLRRYAATVCNGTVDDLAAIDAAIDVAEQAVSGATGAWVEFPQGTCLISARITMPNRVGLRGLNNRGTLIMPHSSFSDDYMFHAVNGTTSMFGSRIEDMHIDARGKNMTAVIWSQAWQDTCGMDRVVIQYDGTTPTGVLLTDGFGGAQYLRFTDVEIFTDSTAVNDIGIDVQEISSVGAFKLHLVGTTINGSVTNVLSKAIRMENDSILLEGFHAEYVAIGLSLEGTNNYASVDTMTGSSNDTTILIDIGSGFTGSLIARNIIPNGAAGPTINNQVTNRDILASDGTITLYEYPRSKFSVSLASTVENVTGNGTTYTLAFDTEIFDELGEFSSTTFTAQRAGHYYFSAQAKFNVPSNSTIGVFQLVTTNRTYVLWRGIPNNMIESGNHMTVSGSVIADMDDGETALLQVIISGIGADTVDVVQDETFFAGHYLSR